MRHTDIFLLELAREMALDECGLARAAVANQHKLESGHLSLEKKMQIAERGECWN